MAYARKKKLSVSAVEANTNIDRALVVLERNRKRAHTSKRSTYVIEALLLFMCIMIVVAVSMSAFAYAAGLGLQASKQESAVSLASNIAEKFSAQPSSISMNYEQDGLFAECELGLSMDNNGAFYELQIRVYEDEDRQAEPLYTLNTAKYESYSSDSGDADPASEAELNGVSDEVLGGGQ